MTVVQNLYQIFKLPASFIVANNCNIEDYTIAQGLKDGNIVSIGDNLVFQQIRYYYKNFKDHHEIFNQVVNIRKNIHFYKKQGQYKEAAVLERYLTNLLFVKDTVNVIIDGKKSDFNLFRVSGFNLNGVHYIYLCSGSGQIRRNTATFINEKLYKKITTTLNCGLDKKTQEYVLAKYSSYFALAFSSILWVRTPRVCVIKDYHNTLPAQKVDFITHDPDTDKAYIEERTMDLDLNTHDGQGLIDPTFATLWGQDMDLPYTPCSFVVRSCFIKGNLVTFDFKEYAATHGITTIRDRWGHPYNINDIDVLISESQFKTYKYYSSWQEYEAIMTAGKIHWGVARYSKQHDDEYVLANYQYIQSLTLSPEDITALCAPTVDWITKICSGDPLYALLYSFGPKSLGCTYQKFLGSAQTNTMKAVIKNIDFLQDPYIQQKIYKNITETINRAKLGKIQIHGNYQFMISDPLAQCQNALGLPVTGTLSANQIYSSWWKTRANNQNITLDTCRSPMIDVHEHNPMTLVTDNPQADYWYRFIYSGIIYNIYDTSTFRHEDSDFDGDIVLATDNPYFIKGSHKDHNIITYEKGLALPDKINIANVTKTVMKGFGTGVGGFSNTATILYAMAAIFSKPEQQDQRDELMHRIKLLREIVGQEIDRIKGADKPSLPPEWKKYEKIEPTDTPEQKLSKIKHNSMVIAKKPYFFRYLYPELNQHYKQFEASYNQISQDMFGIKFRKLLKKPNKTDEEKQLIRKYQKYSPLITSDCNMNRLCREFESKNFDLAFSKNPRAASLLPTFEDEFAPTYNPEREAIVKNLYKTYNARKQIKQLNEILNPSILPRFDDYSELRSSVYTSLIESLQTTLEQNGFTGKEFLFYTHRVAATYASFNWGFAWEVLEDQILDLIPYGRSYYPVRDPASPYTYLGVNYSLVDITQLPHSVLDNTLLNVIDPAAPTTTQEITALDDSAATPYSYNSEELNILNIGDTSKFALTPESLPPTPRLLDTTSVDPVTTTTATITSSATSNDLDTVDDFDPFVLLDDEEFANLIGSSDLDENTTNSLDDFPDLDKILEKFQSSDQPNTPKEI